jgi:hypothetical protein
MQNALNSTDLSDPARKRSSPNTLKENSDYLIDKLRYKHSLKFFFNYMEFHYKCRRHYPNQHWDVDLYARVCERVRILANDDEMREGNRGKDVYFAKLLELLQLIFT